MFALAIALTVLLLLESVPSAVADLMRSQAGIKRLDELTRLGLRDGRNQWVVPLVGAVHLIGSAAVIIGLASSPAAGVTGAAVEAVVFGWVLSRQVSHGDRGRPLGAYLLFLAMALAVLVVSVLRLA
jgi:hypothetical protein